MHEERREDKRNLNCLFAATKTSLASKGCLLIGSQVFITQSSGMSPMLHSFLLPEWVPIIYYAKTPKTFGPTQKM